MTTKRDRERESDDAEESLQFNHDFEFACPHCGENNAITVEGEPSEEEMVQDCDVCCNPITIRIVKEAGGEYILDVDSEE